MKQLKEIIFEKLKINSKSKVDKLEYKYHPQDRTELIKIVDERIKKENDDIDFNDIDTSNIDDMEGIFAYKGKLTKINISEWDVSGVKCMMEMFAGCKKLESIGDISDWKIESLEGVFAYKDKLTKIDISEWDVSNVDTMSEMFTGCKNLESIGDISDWKIADKLDDITAMFYGCNKLTNTGDLNKWDASNILYKKNAFSEANEYIIPKWA